MRRFLMFSPALFLSDFRYRDRLPLFKRRKLAWSVAGLTLVFLLAAVGAAFATSMHSPSYKAAAEKERVALQKQQDAKRAADEAARNASASARTAADARAAESQRAVEASRAADAAKLAADQKAAEASRAAEAAKAAAAQQVADAKAQVASAAAEKKRQQQLYLGFESAFYAAERPGTNATKAFQKSANALAKGDATTLDFYGAVIDAQSKYKDCQSAYWDLHAPDGLPDDIKTILSDATNEAATACMIKAEAFGAMGEYVDTQQVSKAQEYKDKMAEADQATLAAVVKLFEAREKLGVPAAGK